LGEKEGGRLVIDFLQSSKKNNKKGGGISTLTLMITGVYFIKTAKRKEYHTRDINMNEFVFYDTGER